MDNAEASHRVEATVVVVTWNGRDVLRPCLDSLLAQEDGERLEILVIDNGSTDGTVQMVREDFPGISLVELPSNVGFAGGANVGISSARGELVVLLNNDAVAEPGFVRALIRPLREFPNTAAVTGRFVLASRYSPVEPGGGSDLRAVDGRGWVIDPAGTQLINSTGNVLTRSGNGRDRDWLTPVTQDLRTAGPVMGFSGGAVALRRAALNETGPFDERLFMYYEDSDLSWRLRRAGWEIRYEPAAIAFHQHAASSGTGTEFFLSHNERNRLLVALKNAPLPVVVRAFGRTLASASSSLLHGQTRHAARKLKAVGAAIRLGPSMLAERRAIDRTASVPRSAVASMMVAD